MRMCNGEESFDNLCACTYAPLKGSGKVSLCLSLIFITFICNTILLHIHISKSDKMFTVCHVHHCYQ